MNLDNFFEDLNESVGIPAEQAADKIEKKVKSGVSKEEALANIVSSMTQTQDKAEKLLDGTLNILKRKYNWKTPNMMAVSDYIEDYFKE